MKTMLHVSLILVVTLSAWSSQNVTTQVSSDSWREELRYLARELPGHDANAFHAVNRKTFAGLFSLAVCAQQPAPPPVVVQPGAPGKPTRTLTPSTRAKLPPSSPADVQFMQDMIMHHAQAIEMTDLIGSHTENKYLRSLGARISSSQSDEIKFMKRWLAAKGEPISPPMPEMPGMDMASHPTTLMPGMLTPKQMEALKKAKGEEFDHLFLTGMIQHHNGALIMVKDLFDTAGAGQDAELFNFATDVDSGQRAEIRIMQTMLREKPLEEKR